MNPTKLVLHFYDFSMIFHAIYKKQEFHFTIGVTTLQESPRKEICFCNVVHGGGRPARAARFRRAMVGSYGPLGVDLGVGRGMERLRRAARRRPGTATAVAAVPGELGLGWLGEWDGKLW
jgi:hypothetical protein